MTSPGVSAALNPHGLEFDRFLYASVGDDQHGGMLSVVSALARAGVDPWDEAAALARLPLGAAVQALSALLARLPEGQGKPADPVPVAERLVALLPRIAARSAPVQHTPARLSAARSTDHRILALVLATCLLLVLIVQLFLQQRAASELHPLPARDTGPVATQPSSR